MGCGCSKNKGTQVPLANPNRGFVPEKAVTNVVPTEEGKSIVIDPRPNVSSVKNSVTAHPLTDEEIKKREQLQESTEPGLLKKALSLGEAIVDHVVDGLKKTTKEELSLRLSLCDECHHKTSKNICNLCGCGINSKAGWRSSECPDARWPTLKEQ